MRDMTTSVTSREVTVTSDFIAYHRWLSAPEDVKFLRDYHRHLFKVEVSAAVRHNDRQIEFFDMQRTLRAVLSADFLYKYHDLGCEGMAEEIGRKMAFNGYPVTCVKVSEDGENWATLKFDTRDKASGQTGALAGVELVDLEVTD